MARWVVVHIAGRSRRLEAERVTDLRPIDPQDLVHRGTVLTLRDGTELEVDEAVAVMRILLERPA